MSRHVSLTKRPDGTVSLVRQLSTGALSRKQALCTRSVGSNSFDNCSNDILPTSQTSADGHACLMEQEC